MDVFREGVDDPVDTVVITDETLPPRKNRKGKVAWRLPDLESAKGGRLVSEPCLYPPLRWLHLRLSAFG